MVFQSYALFPLMTIHDNIGFPLKVRNVPKAEIDARVKEVADLLVIKHLLEKKPNQLSGGEQQRAALGRAIVRQPNALLMDEPLTSLDAPLRAQMRTELKRIRRETQMTAIYVTHDQAEAMGLADMIAIMSEGKLMQYGPPLDVYSKPKNSFVAGFVGNPPTNILNARFSVDGSGGVLKVDQAVHPHRCFHSEDDQGQGGRRRRGPGRGPSRRRRGLHVKDSRNRTWKSWWRASSLWAPA